MCHPSCQVRRVPDPCRTRSAARRADLSLASLSPLYADDQHDGGVTQGTFVSTTYRTGLSARVRG